LFSIIAEVNFTDSHKEITLAEYYRKESQKVKTILVVSQIVLEALKR
jgi:hypothetical protein